MSAGHSRELVGAESRKVEEEERTRAELHAGSETRLERPRPCDVADRVAAAAEDEERQAKRLDELDAVGVACFQEGVLVSVLLSRRGTRGERHAPRIDKLSVPRRSPESESPPHWSTTADGWYHSMICEMTCGHVRKTGQG